MATIGAALVASGHASTAEPRILTVPAVFIHGLCVAFWGGRAAAPRDRARLGRPRPDRRVFAGDPVAASAADRLRACTGLRPARSVRRVVDHRLRTGVVRQGHDRFGPARDGRAQSLCPGAAACGHRAAPAGAVDRRRTRPRACDPRHCRLVAVYAAAARTGRDRNDLHPSAWRARHGADRSHAGTRPRRCRQHRGHGREFHPFAAKEVTLVIWKPDDGIEPIRRAATVDGRSLWRSRAYAFRSPASGACGSRFWSAISTKRCSKTTSNCRARRSRFGVRCRYSAKPPRARNSSSQ